MKEKLLNSLGIFGVIIWWLISGFIAFLPLAMIGGSFWLNLLLFNIIFFIPSSSVVFWIWGLVCAINGSQDAWAIVYYVLFAVLFLPYFLSTFISMLGKIFGR